MPTSLLIRIVLVTAVLVACGETDRADDTGYDSTVVGQPGANADTAAPSGAGAGIPPEPEVQRQMRERFDLMGGMEKVTITVEGNGTIVLTGTVPYADRKQTAEDVARTIPGVTAVDNRIVVK